MPSSINVDPIQEYSRRHSTLLLVWVYVIDPSCPWVSSTLCKKVFYYFTYMNVLLVYICVYLVPEKPRRGHQILWNWSNRWLRATMWLLRIEPGSSGRA